MWDVSPLTCMNFSSNTPVRESLVFPVIWKNPSKHSQTRISSLVWLILHVPFSHGSYFSSFPASRSWQPDLWPLSASLPPLSLTSFLNKIPSVHQDFPRLQWKSNSSSTSPVHPPFPKTLSLPLWSCDRREFQQFLCKFALKVHGKDAAPVTLD